MTKDEKERLLMAAENIDPEELDGVAEMIKYVYYRLNTLDEDEVGARQRSLIMGTVLMLYGKTLAAKGRALPVKKEDTVNITRQDIVNVLRTELYNIANMKRDCEAVKEVCGGIAPANRITGCLNGMQQITEGLLAIFSTADSSAVIGLELIKPDAPTGGT